ncbi:DUF4397 domain-containing protein [Chitinophaga nivalis]|uniref:DUF4397 domain-containing protein n=1 Tax=Chitinophaga nivalis TaxID=2991709 RepID=A0ABT3IRF1_9BACT|nr:DUF4397 domain-containing protein [Chitinophaga nivalis]MCW3463780.1 DUF4397 domain-containing protein [Chitinophaga nivalis]MCW3486530.1 DUF4397 domain-containing protein [Chitinophaga nivalis]
MKNINNSWLIGMMAAVVFMACQKEVTPAAPEDAQISFYNASDKLWMETRELTGPKVFVLMDSQDTSYTWFSDATSKYPCFSDQNPFQFPQLSVYNSRQPVPWQLYMRVKPGKHTLLLTDTSHRSLVSSEVMTTPGQPVTVFYADKDGVVSTWTVQDHLQWADNKVRLRMMNFCPDGDPVFFTVNGEVPAAFAKDTKYGDIQDFQSFAVKEKDTLRIRFYHPGDTVNAIIGTNVITQVGHSYSIMLRGYANAHSYTDPITGKTVEVGATLKVAACKNY